MNATRKAATVHKDDGGLFRSMEDMITGLFTLKNDIPCSSLAKLVLHVRVYHLPLKVHYFQSEESVGSYFW